MTEDRDDELLADLHHVLGDTFPVTDVLGMAIEMLKLGLTPEDIPDIMRFNYRMRALGLDAEDLLRLAEYKARNRHD